MRQASAAEVINDRQDGRNVVQCNGLPGGLTGVHEL